MSRATIILRSETERLRVADWAKRLPSGTRVDFKEPKRTLDQNALLWSRLSEIARQLPWHGIKITADDYKLIFLDALHRELRIVPNIDGTGFVNLSRSSSDLSKQEFSDLLELIAAFAANHNIIFADQLEPAV